MLFYLYHLETFFGPFRLFHYVTFRAGGAAATAFLISILLGPFTIAMLKKLNAMAAPRYDGLMPEEYIDKRKNATPSMGGILIIFSIVVSTMLWAQSDNVLTYIFIFITIGLGAVGFIDDYIKIAHANRDGVSGKLKLFLQFLVAGISVATLYYTLGMDSYISSFMVPFFRVPVLTGVLGFLVSFPLAILVVVGASNAVNLTDGKDGLAVGPVILCALTYAVFAYICGNKLFAGHLNVTYIAGAGEVGVFAATIIGAGAGFLWYNCHPASMFMGDTGSLALGGAIGLIAVLVKKELVLLIVGGLFVIEALSVIIQVFVYKKTKKRVFLCAPIHHHFERKGWTEVQIVVRFWIIAGIFALLGLVTLKIR